MKRVFAFIAWLIGVATLGYIAFQGFSLVPKMEVLVAAGLAFLLTVSDGIFSFNLRAAKGWGRAAWAALMLVAAGAACAGHWVNFTQKFQRGAHAPKIIAEAQLAAERARAETRKAEMDTAKLEWDHARNEARDELASGKGTRYDALVNVASEMQNIWRESEQAYREQEARVAEMEITLAMKGSETSILADLDWRIILTASIALQIICGGLAWAAGEPRQPRFTKDQKAELGRLWAAEAAEEQRNLRVVTDEAPKKRKGRRGSGY